jgi:predicted PurR-regulated permease PerM
MMAVFFAALLTPIFGWLKRKRILGGLVAVIIVLAFVINALSENIIVPMVMGSSPEHGRIADQRWRGCLPQQKRPA